MRYVAKAWKRKKPKKKKRKNNRTKNQTMARWPVLSVTKKATLKKSAKPRLKEVMYVTTTCYNGVSLFLNLFLISDPEVVEHSQSQHKFCSVIIVSKNFCIHYLSNYFQFRINS